jgi:flagellar hook-length control protein FliK
LAGEGAIDFAALLKGEDASGGGEALLAEGGEAAPLKTGTASITTDMLPLAASRQQALTIEPALPGTPEETQVAVQGRSDARQGPQRAAAPALANAAAAAGLTPANAATGDVPAQKGEAPTIGLPEQARASLPAKEAKTLAAETRAAAAPLPETAKPEARNAEGQKLHQTVQPVQPNPVLLSATAEPSFSMPAASAAEPALAARTLPAAPLVAAPQVNPQAQAAAMQIAEAIAVRAQERSITIRLDPPELGTVRIEMAFDQKGGVTAILAADQPDTTQLLRRHADWLQRDLAAAGFSETTIAWGDAGTGDSRADTPWQRLLLTREAGPAAGGPDIATLPASSLVPGRIDLRL